MLPELVAAELSGETVAERTNAGTTGLLDLATGDWAADLVQAVGVDPAILPGIEPAGRRLGDHHGVPVHLVAAHDTACAVAASPLRAGTPRAFCSAGTWFLVGVEQDQPDTSEAARAANFSNELGAVGGYRFLKNVTGFWLLEQCLTDWPETSAAELLELASTVRSDLVRTFDVQDERFLAPERMEDEVRASSGLRDASRPVVVRSIVESIAGGVAAVVEELKARRPIRELAVVGGGAASPLLHRALTEHAGVAVVPGAVEATALGNCLLQGLSLGRFADLAEARSWACGRSGP
jgi:rhamnulokinase